MTVSIDATQIEEYKRSYALLDVPTSASKAEIKRAYRKLTKRWHPDLYSGESQREATLMMTLFNEAFHNISAAPLKDYRPGDEQHREDYFEQSHVPSTSDRIRATKPRKYDWSGFRYRFFIGAVIGVPMSFRVLLYPGVQAWSFGTILEMLLVVLFFAALFGFGGDDALLGWFRR